MTVYSKFYLMWIKIIKFYLEVSLFIAYKKNGFTLLELMIVLVIVGLLAGIIGPNLFKNLDKSETTVVKAQVDAFTKAIDQYRLDVGEFPNSNEGLKVLVQAGENSENWKGPYIKKIPLDPWGMPYQYRVPSEFNLNYDVFSTGKDKKIGGEGENLDIGNW